MASRVAAVQIEQPRPSRTYANARPQPRRAAEVPYRIERVRDAAGLEREILTLEDTPEPGSASTSRSAAAAAQPPPPVAGPSYSNGNAHASTSSARHDPYSGYEPAAKKRKSDVGASHRGYAPVAGPSNGYPQPGTYAPAASTSGTKRKHDDSARDSRDKQSQPDQSYSDADGHFIVRLDSVVRDDNMGQSYTIKKQLGQGTFGKVVQAENLQDRRQYAVKIIRAVHKYQEAAKTEIRVLKALRKYDPDNVKKCIPLLHTFDFYGHTCLVTPLLSASVFDFLKDNSYEPFPLSHVQAFAKQLLTSIKYVHDSNLIHTDLKPENILLENNASVVIPGKRTRNRKILKDTSIQLIDFGSATFDGEYHAQVVSTRHYRAPEIILCTGWSYPCDMWSIGCILVEFVTGEALFQTHDNLEHLAMMQQVFGDMPSTLLSVGRKQTAAQHPDWFKKGKGGRYALNFPQPSTQKQSRNFVKGMKQLRNIIAPRDAAGEAFFELCQGLLRWDPKDRWDVNRALNSRFITSCKIVDEGVLDR
ncbi:kinase-like protein [Rhodotorula sp. JG-1b]|nr:kinase-like protein [Rhodotorula sp. JG-1b]